MPCGLVLIILRSNLGTITECLIHQLIYRIGRRSQRRVGLDKFKVLLGGTSENLRELRQRGLVGVLRIQQQEFRLRQVGIRKADVEL